MTHTTQNNNPELLINDAHGIYIGKLFCEWYGHLITNKDKLQEDIDICLSGPDHEDYIDAWVNVIDNAEIVTDKGEKFTVGNLGESGDLWAIPEGYEYPEEY
jgi:hypothetical protein